MIQCSNRVTVSLGARGELFLLGLLPGWGSIDTHMSHAIPKTLGLPSEPNGKNLLLEILHN